MKIYILAGGFSYEREISLMSAKEIDSSIDKSKYDVEILEIPEDKSTIWIEKLLSNPPDLVLSALHGGIGEDGSVQGLLNCMDIPYIGSRVLSSALSMDKHMSKKLLKYHSIQVPEDILVKNENDFLLYENNILDMGFPLIAKPNLGGSSVGIKIVDNIEELKVAVDNIFKLGDYALVEKYIDGDEVTCGIIETDEGLTILPVLDIKTKREFYDYDAKYIDKETDIDFSSLPEFIQNMIHSISERVFKILNCHGYGRVDMMVKEEQVYVIEMNTLPGLTAHSLIPKAASKMEYGFTGLLDRLINFEMDK